MSIKNTPVSIILPVHNEINIIKGSVEKVLKNLEKTTISYKVIIAEDGSKDNTDVVARKLASTNIHVIHIHSDERLGRGRALKRAFKIVNAEVFAYMDADLATDLSILPNLIEIVQQNRGLATASRNVSGSKVKRPVLRKITSSFTTGLCEFCSETASTTTNVAVRPST